MFSKAKKRQDEQGLREVEDFPLPAAPAARTATAKPAPRAKPARPAAGVPSIICADVVIRGSIEAEGEVQFDGEIHGDLKAKGLVIGEGAVVSGEVIAEKVRVCGTVEGAIRATRVELAAGALVKGDISHTALAIEAGARFEGNVRHSDDPIGEADLPPAAPAPMPVLADLSVAPAALPTAEDEPALEMAEPILTRKGRAAKADLR